ncbi:MAG: hypothetical protein FD159_493 [Syntrophaceae bacterium]|nr:MAG: hypothetical protein FD159_493 [Syntrophaceae bacterium]
MIEIAYMIELLKKLNTDVTFRPDNGAFRSKLVETVIDNADEEYVELFSANSCDIQVIISNRTIDEGVIRFVVGSDLGEQSLECDVSVLSERAIHDLTGQLTRLIAEQSPPETHCPPKVIIRKNYEGMLNIHQAAQKLGCSQIFLKSRIPCTYYTYNEVNGKKEIKEYYWSKNLIDRLCNSKMNGIKEDVKYIAEECCEGDYKWAEEILGLLAHPMSMRKVDAALPKNITKQPVKFIAKGTTSTEPSRKKIR